MVPIVSIFNLISALFFVGVSLKIYSSYLKNKDEKLKDFLKVFLFFIIALILIGSPGIVFNDLKIVGFIYAVYPIFIFFALSYLVSIPLKIMGWQKIKEIFFRGLIGTAFLITVINIFNWKPAVIYYRSPFIYWQDSRGILMNNVLGAILGISLLLIIIFFIIQGSRTAEKYLKIRAFLITGGLLSFMASSVTNFIFGASSQAYASSLFATLFNILAAILFLTGIYYKPKLLR